MLDSITIATQATTTIAKVSGLKALIQLRRFAIEAMPASESRTLYTAVIQITNPVPLYVLTTAR